MRVAGRNGCFTQNFGHAPGGGSDSEVHEALPAVRAFLEKYGDRRFTPWPGSDASATRLPDRAGFRHQEEDGPYFHVLPEVFRHEVCRGHDQAALARAMVERGWLKIQAPDRHTYKARLPCMGKQPTNVYLITPAIWPGGR